MWRKILLRKAGDVVLFIVIMGLLLPFVLIGCFICLVRRTVIFATTPAGALCVAGHCIIRKNVWEEQT